MTTTAATSTTRPCRHRPRINVRMLVVGLVLLLPIAWIVYTFAKQSLGSGIEQVGEYKEVNLKAMGNFPFDESSDDAKQVPEIYRALDGQKVLLTGEMFSDTSASYADSYQLVYSIAKCCFGGPPKVQERVFVHTSNGQRLPIQSGLWKNYGTLHVRPVKQNGRVISVYDMDVTKIEAYE